MSGVHQFVSFTLMLHKHEDQSTIRKEDRNPTLNGYMHMIHKI